MSPFATWLISWPTTASTSSLFIRWSRPVLTATRASLRFQPVAKAFGSGESKMPTSGIWMPASFDWRSTVSISQRSNGVPGWSMICTPMPRFAMVFDRNSEIKDPLKPMMAAMTSREPMLMPPLSIRTPSRPSSRKTTLMTTRHGDVGA